MVPRDAITTPPAIGRRRAARLRVRLDARLITLDGTARAVLADISEHGAKVSGIGMSLRSGSEAVLQWAGREAFGVVVWSDGRQCGIEFYDPMSAAEIRAARRLDETAHAPGEGERLRQAARAFVQGKARI